VRNSHDFQFLLARLARRTVQWSATSGKHMGNREITQEAFDRLLSWLDPDRSRAGERYETLRRKLVTIFAARGGAVPEEMADDCINRVIQKIPEVIDKYEGAPEFYFYGVAKIIVLEWNRRERPVELPAMADNLPEIEGHYACLEKCLGQLAESSRELVLEYYQQDKRAKINHRVALAKRLGIAANALRIRAHRIRQVLEKCVLQCIDKPAGLRYQ
jgi:DNA-directed RNA polymerase specialized sigma24 family protein